MNIAWMLRQDGEAFPVTNHIYCMMDEDLSSEADAASFIIYSKSKDLDLAKYVLDCYMALLIENSFRFDMESEQIDELIANKLSSLPYKFHYPLKIDEYLKIHNQLNNFYDFDSYYDFLDEVKDNILSIQTSIKDSLNQQFCRSRFGGQYTNEHTNGIWFRISSVGYNWADVIYIWVTNNYRKYKINSIYICRDYESDNGESLDEPEYFYKAKDGTPYFDMLIGEYLKEEHEHSPVFSNTIIDWNSGIFSSIRKLLNRGDTLEMVATNLSNHNLAYDRDIRNDVLNREIKSKCINCSEYFDNLTNKNKNKFNKVFRTIKHIFPEISDIDVDYEEYGNGFKLIFTVKYLNSKSGKSKYINIESTFTNLLSAVPVDLIVRKFRTDFSAYLNSLL